MRLETEENVDLSLTLPKVPYLALTSARPETARPGTLKRMQSMNKSSGKKNNKCLKKYIRKSKQ